MREHRYSFDIPHSAARVWALFQDYERWTDYAPMVKLVDILWPGDEQHNGRLRRVIYEMPFGREGSALELVTDVEGEALSYGAYPNPAVEKILVRAKVKSTIVMYNASGRVVLETEMDNSDITLKVGHLEPGLYLLSVDDGMGARVFRVFKQ